MPVCPVCESAHVGGAEGDYGPCASCGSYIYISSRSAEDDNRSFFNDMYGGAPDPRRSRIKSKIFRAFQKKDRLRNAGEYGEYRGLRTAIDATLRQAGRLVEIGFGEGRMLASLLKEGVDAYGVDISESIVHRFQKRHPEFRDRVRVGSRLDEQVSVVYCSALLEHLDNPTLLIQDASSSLKKTGLMIVDNVPVLSAKTPSITTEEDSCFWKPCHRIVFSLRGLKGLFERHGFQLERHAMIDSYNYRVLSVHIREGFSEIIRLRSSCLSHRGLPGILRYYSLCRQAVDVNSVALAGSFIFRRL